MYKRMLRGWAWLTAGMMIAALGCGNETAGSAAGTTSGSGTTTSASGSGGAGGGACAIKSAECQSCLMLSCPASGQAWSTFEDCMCTAQMNKDSAAEDQCIGNYTLTPGGEAENNCMGTACGSKCG